MISRRRPILLVSLTGVICVLWTLGGMAQPMPDSPRRAGADEVVSLFADADTWLAEADPTANYGDQPSLSLGLVDLKGTTYQEQVLLRFGSKLPAGEVTGATLQIHQTQAGGAASYQVWPYAVTASWDELKTGWSSRPAAVDAGAPAAWLDLQPDTWVKLDVTAIAQAWADGEVPMEGILLLGDAKTLGRHIFSARSGNYPPELVVTYKPTLTPTNTSTPTATETSTSTPTATATNTPTPTATPGWDFRLGGGYDTSPWDLDPLVTGEVSQIVRRVSVITVAHHGVQQDVKVSVAGLPPEVIWVCTPDHGVPPFSGVCTLTVAHGNVPAPGDYAVKIAVAGGGVRHEMAFTLHIVRAAYGDLQIAGLQAVQVLDQGALVTGKGTAFRVAIQSSFAVTVYTTLRLELPPAQWSTDPACGAAPVSLPVGFVYPEVWGPVPIGPGSQEIMLPWVQHGHEDLPFDPVTNPAGVINCPCEGAALGSWCAPPVRLVPRPILPQVTYGVDVDPDNTVDETNESDNSASASTTSSTENGWRFLIVPASPIDPLCTPNMTYVISGTVRQLSYLLGTFPIADAKLKYMINPIVRLRETREDGDCYEDDLTYFGDLSYMGLESGFDFVVAVTCGGGGTTRGMASASVGDHSGAESVAMAHEFNHAVTGMPDIYALDAAADWDESYCEDGSGNRYYACFVDMPHPNGWVGPYCVIDPSGNPICPDRRAKSCVTYCGCSIYPSSTDPRCAGQPRYTRDQCYSKLLGQAQCWRAPGALWPVYTAPDGRIHHPAGKGMWVNRWRPVNTDTNYFMDAASGPYFPHFWQRLGNTSGLWTGAAYYDGYRNLMSSAFFWGARDPAALLIGGVVYTGTTTSAVLDPFVRLPQSNLDLAPGHAGEYQVSLRDGNGKVLTATGFDLAFSNPDPLGGPADAARFAYRIAWAEGTTTIELRQGDRLLASRTVSAHAPQVKLTGPVAGAIYTAGETVPLAWTGQDDDGDELSYAVMLSSDTGQTWLPAAARLAARTFDLDTTSLPPGDYLFKVRASDGVNTASDVLAAPVTIKSNRDTFLPMLMR